MDAYAADYVTRDGKLIIDEPAVRLGLVKALAAYTAIWHKGCTPPSSTTWNNRGNNEAFLSQTVLMTVNNSMSIPIAIRDSRPDDYARNAVTVGWPYDSNNRPLSIYNGLNPGAVFRDGGHLETAKEFVQFLVGKGWLGHWFDFTADRWIPTIRGLIEQPFWLDPGDPHRLAAATQFLDQPRDYWEYYAAISGNWRHDKVYSDHVWPTAVHRVAAEGLAPAEAVDQAIAQIHQILGE